MNRALVQGAPSFRLASSGLWRPIFPPIDMHMSRHRNASLIFWYRRQACRHSQVNGGSDVEKKAQEFSRARRQAPQAFVAETNLHESSRPQFIVDLSCRRDRQHSRGNPLLPVPGAARFPSPVGSERTHPGSRHNQTLLTDKEDRHMKCSVHKGHIRGRVHRWHGLAMCSACYARFTSSVRVIRPWRGMPRPAAQPRTDRGIWARLRRLLAG